MKPSKFRDLCLRVIELYARHRIPVAAAGLSYFLTLSVFPLLICVYTMLGSLFPSDETLRGIFAYTFPPATLQAISDYLHYVSDNLSTPMLVMALLALAGASSAAFRIIDRTMGALRGRRRFSDFFAWVFSFFFSLIFLAAVYFSVLLIVTGKWFLDFVDRHLMFINISDAWHWWRFVLLFAVMFCLICGVYKITAPREGRARLLPGALAATLGLEGVSMLFSLFIGASVKYPLVYGSLASVMIIMFWLYICGVILFLGNVLNVALEQQ